MNVVVVTGFVEIPGHPRDVQTYNQLGSHLAELREAPVRVYRSHLDSCWLGKHVSEANVAQRGVADSPEKNSLAYHVVQHEKTAWLASAAETDPKADVLVWLDYGIVHQPRVAPQVIDAFLRHVREHAKIEVAIPGAWDEAAKRSPFEPNWRFLGSTLVVHRALAGIFHRSVRRVALDRWYADRFVTWEVNDWAEVELLEELPIRWYQADHDQTQFTNYPQLGHAKIGF